MVKYVFSRHKFISHNNLEKKFNRGMRTMAKRILFRYVLSTLLLLTAIIRR